ncbi:MAG: FAD:protein FMN transferase [Planctomycetota bacterium]
MDRLAALLVPMLALAQIAREPQSAQMREHSGVIMGSSLSIKVIGEDSIVLEKALAEAVTELERIEDLMTDWRDSPLTRLNAAAGQGAQKVPEELAAIIARSIELHKLTNGAFDITYASAGELWNYKRADFKFPTPEQIEAAKRHIDASKVRVDAEHSTVELPAGMRIGLGGIAQGYGADRAMAVLQRCGIRNALIDVSGDLKILGAKFGSPWEIAIKHPRERDRALGVLKLSNTCLTTSGDYERFFLHDGKRFHHIIDPRTGYPSTGCMSATVIAPNAEYGDALATALCVLGPQEGLALAARLDRIEVLLVGQDGTVVMSPGLKRLLP